MAQSVKINIKNNYPGKSVIITRFELDLGQGKYISPDQAVKNLPLEIIYTDTANIIAEATDTRLGIQGNIKFNIVDEGDGIINFTYTLSSQSADINGQSYAKIGDVICLVTTTPYDSYLNVNIDIGQ